jgi:hypothetical protein
MLPAGVEFIPAKSGSRALAGDCGRDNISVFRARIYELRNDP